MQEITNIIYSKSMAFLLLILFYLKYSIRAQWKEKLYPIGNLNLFFQFWREWMEKQN